MKMNITLVCHLIVRTNWTGLIEISDKREKEMAEGGNFKLVYIINTFE